MYRQQNKTAGLIGFASHSYRARKTEKGKDKQKQQQVIYLLTYGNLLTVTDDCLT